MCSPRRNFQKVRDKKNKRETYRRNISLGGMKKIEEFQPRINQEERTPPPTRSVLFVDNTAGGAC